MIVISVARRDTETSEFIEDLQGQIRDLNKANEALKNKVMRYYFVDNLLSLGLLHVIILQYFSCSEFRKM